MTRVSAYIPSPWATNVLDVEGRSADGVAAMVYPGQGVANLRGWDLNRFEWFDSNTVTVTGPVTSIGFFPVRHPGRAPF